jgi:16S rRNA U1498 N3-methylase RsmE
LIEGLCQAGDVQLPKLKVIKHLLHFLEDNVDAMFPHDEYAKVVAHPQRNNSTAMPLRMNQQVVFPSHTDSKPTRMVIAAGTEGGWAEPEELDMFETLGFQQVPMGTRICEWFAPWWEC